VLDTHDFASMRRALQELKPSLDRLREASDKTWNGMLSIAAGVDSDSPLGWLLWCFRQYPSLYGTSAVRAFIETVDSKERDPRPLLAGSYIAYRNWRAWLLRLVGMLQRQPQDLPDHATWRAAEIEFFSELEKKLSGSLLGGVRIAISEYDAANGKWADLLPRVIVVPEPGGPGWKPLTVSISSADQAWVNELKQISQPSNPDNEELPS
jgi:hypothetical protein